MSPELAVLGPGPPPVVRCASSASNDLPEVQVREHVGELVR
jgi:hypothetical protein